MSARRRAAMLAATALAVLPLSQIARAQDIGSVVSFGDSLSDNGNLFTVQSALGLDVSTPSPPYAAGRFSNGPVLTEYLNGPMQKAGAAGFLTSVGQPTPVDPGANQNYAFGGARTDRLDSPPTGPGVPPGIPAQIDYFQTLDGSLSSGDVVTLYGGANDIFQYLGSTPPASITVDGIVGTSTVAAANLGASADRLSDLGAPRLVVLNLPDLGAIPQFSASPTVSSVATLSTTSFNSALEREVFASAAANPQTDTYYIDVFRLADAIAAQPARFGFDNITEPCISVPSCVSASTEAQNRYQFFDPVHPTTRGHELFASLVLDYLTAGETAAQVGSLSETAILDRLEGVNAAFSRGRTIATAIAADGAPQDGFYATLGGATYDRDAAGRLDGYDYDSATLRLGVDRVLSEQFVVGASVSAMTGDVDNSVLTYDTRSFAADLYGTALFGAAHVSLVAGVAHYDFDEIQRRTAVPTVTNTGGDTNGVAANIGAEAGYSFALGALTATPTLGLTYVRFDVDGFTETGLGARIAYHDYDRDALYGSAALDLTYDTVLFGTPSRLTGRIGYEGALSNGDDAIVSGIDGSPNRSRGADFADLPGRGFVLGGGARMSFTDSVAAQVSYSAGFSDDIDFSQTGHLGVTVRF